MKEKRNFDRIFVLSAIVFFIALVFVVRLIQFQVVDGAKYREIADNLSTYKITVDATRGEIIDRNNVPIATNRTSFNVEFTKYFLEEDKLNDTILTLNEIITRHKDQVVNDLPISLERGNFVFQGDKQEDIDKLIAFTKLNQYATAENIIDKLAEEYELFETDEEGNVTNKDTYTKDQLLVLTAVRYQMDQIEFSNFNPLYTFAEDLKTATVTEIQEEKFDMPGVEVVQKAVREYNDPTLAPHTIGDIGLINKEEYDDAKAKGKNYAYNAKIGKFGIEALMEDQLRGEDGERTVVRNKNGDIVDVVTTKTPKEGNTVQLTIDTRLQKTAQNLLAEQMNSLPGSKGAALVALDPRNGEVLAIANYPSYDLKKYRKEYEKYANDTERTPLLDRAATGLYRPGSAYKPAMVVAGVENGFITDANFTVNCTHVYERFPDQQFKCLGTHGYINSYRAIAVSCNIFFYETGYKIQLDGLKKTSNQLGLGVETGYDLNEAVGGIGTVENEGDIVQLAVGQGNTQVTPLQMATYVSTIANGGTRYKPQIVQQITNFPRTEVLQKNNPEIKFQYVNQENAFQIVQNAMEATSFYPEGTSYSMFSGFSPATATKTGSPEPNNPLTEIGHGSFIAYAPADNPQIAIAVFGEHVDGGRNMMPVVKGVIDAHINKKYKD